MDANETRAKTVDEAEREEAETGKKKKQKPPKAPKPKKEKKPKPAKAAKPKGGKKKGKEPSDGDQSEGKERRPHPVRNTLILTSLLWILLIAAVVLVCRLGYYDEYGDYQFLLDQEGVIRGPVLLFLNPEELDREEYYSSEIESLADWEAELEEREADLAVLEAELEFREEEIDEWETSVEEREALLDELIPDGEDPALPVTSDIATLAKAWGEMTPANAAAAIGEMSDDEVTVRVLSLLKAKTLGKILDAMNSEEAARISELLADPPTG